MEQIRKADLVRTRKLTGWKPRTTLSSGLRSAIEYYGRRTVA